MTGVNWPVLLKPTRELCSSEVWSCLIHRWWTKPRICCRSCQCVRAFPPAGKSLLGWMGIMGLNFGSAFQVCWNKNETKLKRSGQCNPCVCVVQPFNDPGPLRLHLVPGRFWTSFAKLLPQSRAPCTRGRFCCYPLWWMDRPEAMIFKKSRTGFWTAAKHVDFKFSSFEHRESCVRAGTHWHSQSYPEQIVGSCL